MRLLSISSLAVLWIAGSCGAAEPLGKTFPVAKTYPIGKSESTSAADPAGRGDAPAGRGDAAGKESAASGDGPLVKDCVLRLIEEPEVPGREAGVLVALEAKEGMQVKAGATLGHIDDIEPTVQKKIKQAEHDAAKEEAENDIDVQYARKATEVAAATYQKNLEADRKVKGSISAVDLDKAKLEAEKSRLGIEQAQHKQRVNAFVAEGKGAEVEAAEASIQRRQIKSPIDGVVTKVFRHVGEWVAPGDPVVKIVRVDRLRIEGSLNSADYDAHEIDGRAVTVEVLLAHGRRVKVPGKIVFVDPEVRSDGEYRIFAEVTNRQEKHDWVLRPGLFAEMQIHLK